MGERCPFRFGVIVFGASSREAWIEQARRAETLGYSTFSVGEHVVTEFDAGAALASAALWARSLSRLEVRNWMARSTFMIALAVMRMGLDAPDSA